MASETRLTNFKQQWRMEEKFMHRLIGFKKRGGNYRALITALFYHCILRNEIITESKEIAITTKLFELFQFLNRTIFNDRRFTLIDRQF